jgi:hypothetical protein
MRPSDHAERTGARNPLKPRDSIPERHHAAP